MSNVLHALALHFIIASLTGMKNSLHVLESEIETQRGSMTCSKLHSK